MRLSPPSAQPVKLLVIEASGIIDIDYTGAKILQEAVADLKAQGIVIAIARLSEKRAQDAGTPLGPGRSDRPGSRLHVGRGSGAQAPARPARYVRSIVAVIDSPLVHDLPSVGVF